MKYRLLLGTVLAFAGLVLPVAPGAVSPRVGAQSGTGQTTVLSEGVALMPQVPVAWRAVRAVARPVGEAPFAERALGFLLADDDPLLVTDEVSGAPRRVMANGALFVPQSVRQRRASTVAYAVGYYGLELVVAPDVTAGYSLGSASLIHGGVAFAPPKGQNRITLHQHLIGPSDTAVLDETESPRLVLATSGGMRIRLSGGTEVELRDGQATTVSGRAEVVSTGGNQARFVTATVGAEDGVGRVAPGSFAVTTYACPPGMTFPTLDTDACGESRDNLVTWILSSSHFARTLVQDDAVTQGATTTWSDLPAGQYMVTLRAERFATGYLDYFIPSSNEVTRQGFATTAIAFDTGKVIHSYRAYVFSDQPSIEPGPFSVVLDVESCPPGTTLPEIQAVGCDAVSSGFEATLSGDQLDSPLTLAQADFTSDQPRWVGLPGGSYLLTFNALPNGHDTSYVFATPDQGTAVSRVGDSLAGFAFSLGPATTGENGAVVLHSFFVTSGEPAAVSGAAGQPVTIGVVVWDCPPGVVAMPDMTGAGCAITDPNASKLNLTLVGAALATPLILSDASAGGGNSWFWGGVPLGDYTLTATLPPNSSGYAVRATGFSGAIRPLRDGTGYAMTLDEGLFSQVQERRIDLDVYLLYP